MKQQFKPYLALTLVMASFLLVVGVVYALTVLNVSLSPNTPPGGYLAATSTNVAFTTFNFNYASSTEKAILDKIAITNYGNSSTSARIFSRLYLYDNYGLIASTTSVVNNNIFIFKNLNYQFPTSTISALTIKGDLSGEATSSQTIIMGLAAANHIKAHGAATGRPTAIQGVFPIVGNTFTIY